MHTQTSFDLIVIGGGAAGFFAAINTAEMKPTSKVLILEKTGKLLSKVRVSGGGRCNVTHACFNKRDLVKHYPRGEKELMQAFSYFDTTDTINWFEQRGVTLVTENDGRMFPETNTSETIVQCLMNEAKKNNVEIRLNTEVTKAIKNKDLFELTLGDGSTLLCKNLLLASGGNPKITGYSLPAAFGHTIIEPNPSLFTFNMPGNPATKLMGLSNYSQVSIKQTNLKNEGPLLITHWGMSGPAILKLSAWGARELQKLNYEFTAVVKWLPEFNFESLRSELDEQRTKFASRQLISHPLFGLPKRLWEFFLYKARIDEYTTWSELPRKAQNKLEQILLADEYPVKGKTTFKEEFVTCGGIALNELDFNTMQSKKVPGLFFAGEVIDVDGITGGFNFQNAWTTGWIAAKGIVEI